MARTALMGRGETGSDLGAPARGLELEWARVSDGGSKERLSHNDYIGAGHGQLDGRNGAGG
jgi:hypothetical protein